MSKKFEKWSHDHDGDNLQSICNLLQQVSINISINDL